MIIKLLIFKRVAKLSKIILIYDIHINYSAMVMSKIKIKLKAFLGGDVRYKEYDFGLFFKADEINNGKN